MGGGGYQQEQSGTAEKDVMINGHGVRRQMACQGKEDGMPDLQAAQFQNSSIIIYIHRTSNIAFLFREQDPLGMRAA